MNITRLKYFLLLAALGVILFGSLVAPAQAGSANFYLSSGNRKINTGTTFTIPVRVYPNGASIDTARVILNFSPTVLQATQFKFASGLDTAAPANFIDNHKGLISWGGFDMQDRIEAPTVFGLVTFKAIAEGRGQITLASSSKIISGGEDVSNPSAYNQVQVTVAPAPNSLAVSAATNAQTGDLPPEYRYQLPTTSFICTSIPASAIPRLAPI